MRNKLITVLVAIMLIASMVGSVGLVASDSPTTTGEINLSGNPATDGSTYQYNLGENDTYTNLSVKLTGRDNVETDSTSGTLSSGTAESVEVVSDKSPKNETITLSAQTSTNSESKTGGVGDGGSVPISTDGSITDASISITSVDGYQNSATDDPIGDSSRNVFTDQTQTWTIPSGDVSTVSKLRIPILSADPGDEITVSIDGSHFDTSSGADSAYGVEMVTFSGSQSVGSSFDLTVGLSSVDPDSGDEYVAPDTSEGDVFEIEGPDVSPGTISVDYPGGSTSLTNGDTNTINDLSGSGDFVFNHGGGTAYYDISWTEEFVVSDISGSVGSTSISTSGELTSSITRSVNLSDGSNTVDMSYSGPSNALNYDLSWDETTETRDPKVSINGNEVGVSGTLADGETRSLSVSEDWLKSGTNNVSISMTSPTGGPDSLVGFTYSHETTGSAYTSDLNATTWSETYEIQSDYDTSQSDVSISIPFSKNVISIEDVEFSKNGGPWQSPSNSGLSNGVLGIDVGSVDPGDTIEVRATGRKISVSDGSISIDEPTVAGNELETTFTVDEAGSKFALDVGRTEPGSKLHVLGSSSWSSDERSEFSSTQELRLPNAPTGGKATVSTVPLEVDPLAGDVTIEWADDATQSEPRFHVKPGGREGDTVDYRFTAAVSNDEYALYSEEGVVHDSAVANSPVTLQDDDSKETLQIVLEDDTSDIGDSGGGGTIWENPGSSAAAAGQAALSIMPVIDPVWIVMVVIGLIGMGVAYSSRDGSPTASKPLWRRPSVGLSVLVAIGLAVLLISPTTITAPLQSTLGAVLPLAGIVGIAGGALWLLSLREDDDGGGSGGSPSRTRQAFRVVTRRNRNTGDTGDDGWFK